MDWKNDSTAEGDLASPTMNNKINKTAAAIMKKLKANGNKATIDRFVEVMIAPSRDGMPPGSVADKSGMGKNVRMMLSTASRIFLFKQTLLNTGEIKCT